LKRGDTKIVVEPVCVDDSYDKALHLGMAAIGGEPIGQRLDSDINQVDDDEET